MESAPRSPRFRGVLAASCWQYRGLRSQVECPWAARGSLADATCSTPSRPHELQPKAAAPRDWVDETGCPATPHAGALATPHWSCHAQHSALGTSGQASAKGG
jgi:hypothetical protein